MEADNKRTTILAEDATPDEVQRLLKSLPMSVVLAVASFAPKCKALLQKLETAVKENESGGCCSGIEDYNIIIIRIDKSNELEEIAIDLGLEDVPSYQIYKRGKIIAGSKEVDVVTADSIKSALEKAASPNISSCCVPSSSASSDPAVCCPPGSSHVQLPTDSSDIHRLVAQSYSDTVNKRSGGGCCESHDATLNGYSAEELRKAGAENANLGLGCGNPLSFADLSEGETVVDLGSGAGIDCFLASDKVGRAGTVIGVDMTPDMLHSARQNAKKRIVDSGSNGERHDNVEFRLGEIEYLPIPNDTVDCVISNCVINLSPGKAQVLRDIYRVLKPGGRIAISDVVNRPDIEIPDRLKTAQALAC
jgi:arsenite methyltransferase